MAAGWIGERLHPVGAGAAAGIAGRSMMGVVVAAVVGARVGRAATRAAAIEVEAAATRLIATVDAIR
jgi:hypothetical protein